MNDVDRLIKRLREHEEERKKLVEQLQARREHMAADLVAMELASNNVAAFATELANREAIIFRLIARIEELQHVLHIIQGPT